MICGAADEGSAALFVCGGGGTDLAPAPWHLPHRRARWHRRADDARVGGGGLRNRGYSTGNLMISRLRAS